MDLRACWIWHGYSIIRASLATYHLISNARSWNNHLIFKEYLLVLRTPIYKSVKKWPLPNNLIRYLTHKPCALSWNKKFQIISFSLPWDQFKTFFLSKFYAFPFLSADFCTQRMKAARTIDGTCNDLNNTAAGSRFYRFGRNVPLEYTYTNSTRLLSPDPRILART